MVFIAIQRNSYNNRAQFVTVNDYLFRVGPSSKELTVAAQEGYIRQIPKQFFPRFCRDKRFAFPDAFTGEELARMKNRAIGEDRSTATARPPSVRVVGRQNTDIFAPRNQMKSADIGSRKWFDKSLSVFRLGKNRCGER